MMHDHDDDYRPWRRVIWGLLLIGLGVAFLLDRLAFINVASAWHLWPLFVVAIGLMRFFEGRPGSGVSTVLLGGWFLACTTNWHSFTWHETWPIALVAIGLGIVIRSFTHEDSRRWRRWRRRHGCCGFGEEKNHE